MVDQNDQQKELQAKAQSSIFNRAARRAGETKLRGRDDICVKDVVKLHNQGRTIEQIATHFALPLKEIETALGVAMHHLPKSHIFKRNKKGTHILLDENMRHGLMPYMIRDDIRLSHISFQGLTSHTDLDIYRHACAHKVRVIVTSDSDFISIVRAEVMRRLSEARSFDSVDVSDLPFIIHCPHKMESEKALTTALHQAFDLYLPRLQDKPALIWACLDQKGQLDDGKTPREIYESFLRGTAEGYMPPQPIFDHAFIDDLALNNMATSLGLAPIAVTADQKNYDLLADMKGTARKQKPPYKNPYGPKP